MPDELTWMDLLPLLKQHYSHDDRLGLARAFHRIEPVIKKIAAPYWHGSLRLRAEHPVLKYLEIEVAYRLTEKLYRCQGLTVPPEYPDQPAILWIGRVIRNQIRDHMESLERRANREIPTEVHDFSNKRQRADLSSRYDAWAPSDPERALQVKESLSAVERRLSEAGFPPQQRLAWVLRCDPASYDFSLSQRAYQGGGVGVLRPPEETHDLLRAWLARGSAARIPQGSASAPRAPASVGVGGRPMDDLDELCWILRSTDRSDPQSWRERDPQALVTARNTVQNWLNHACNRLSAVA